MNTAKGRMAQVRAVIRVASGNFLEMYDFMVFGYYASAIARTFFPNGSAFAGLMLSLMTFGAGVLDAAPGRDCAGFVYGSGGAQAGIIAHARPDVCGNAVHRVCAGLCAYRPARAPACPGGAIAAGLSAGVELGGVSVYLAEIATPGNKGFYVSWQSASQQCAVIFAALLGVLFSSYLSPTIWSGGAGVCPCSWAAR